ncbi:MAG TPA: HEXXH motif-containing putative peptide modification protein [Leptospiraceae bacterium]|nr:HEXXH motif-containing putative peptide modification protein [Leptospiraceae bacterium]HNH10382.1 HEXXH motif-containing putative peptide modification protein [Leptospiraceae bacterium]HNI96350.1 HEXXH motif-containing putative peptide modification protein [Leptospiraceae bacterium]HNN03673.1 HEXXH motif-containing putative peptide modification protein [Leptospiraceae bacterium]
MFTLKSVAQIQEEYRKSLIEEYSKTKEKSAQFEKYRDAGSLAGMESYLNSKAELTYFQDMQKELEKTPEKKIEEFQKMTSVSLQNDFPEEDFRFIEWERTAADKRKLDSVLKDIIRSIQENQKKLNENYLRSESDLKHYMHSVKSPKVTGVGNELVKKKTPESVIKKFRQAEEDLETVWKEGFELYRLLTYKSVIMRSDGLVSYTHFHEPGISYFNLIDRNYFEVIDDLIHENAHHHLNLLFKKYKILRNEKTEHMFYSPWRDSLRPLYAILHACFTFTWGSMLFFHICTSNSLKYTDLKEKDVSYSAYRFLAESLMLDYSLNDLESEKKLFTPEGKEILDFLIGWNRTSFDFRKVLEKRTDGSLLAKAETLRKHLNKMKKQYVRK